SLQLPEDQRAVRPRTAESDIQVITARFGPEAAFTGRARRPVGGDPVPDHRRGALEASVPVIERSELFVRRPATVDHRAHAFQPVPPPALQSRDRNRLSTYQNISAIEANSSSAAATWRSSG